MHHIHICHRDFFPHNIQLLVFRKLICKNSNCDMCASADRTAVTHFSTSPRCCFGDLSRAKKVDLDANLEYQRGKVRKLSEGCYCCKAYDHPCLQDKEKFPGS